MLRNVVIDVCAWVCLTWGGGLGQGKWEDRWGVIWGFWLFGVLVKFGVPAKFWQNVKCDMINFLNFVIWLEFRKGGHNWVGWGDQGGWFKGF